MWIVCKDRLCSTKKNIPLSDYQKDILLKVAKTIYSKNINADNVFIKREVPIPNNDNSTLSADYALRRNTFEEGPNKIILEMQGGGETSNTGPLTENVKNWEAFTNRTNEMLSQDIPQVGTIENNAMKRQLFQFLVKGNVATQTGGRIVFCVGSLLYNYIIKLIHNHNLNDLRGQLLDARLNLL